MKNLLTLAGLAAAALVVGCGDQTAEQPEIVRPVRAMQVGNADSVSNRWFPGRAQATQEANLAFEVAGRLIEQPVDVGDRIAPGDLLAALDPRDFQNDLESAMGEQDRAQAQRDRVAQAAETGAVSQQDLTNAEADLRIAQSVVKIRQKALDDTRLTGRSKAWWPRSSSRTSRTCGPRRTSCACSTPRGSR